MTDLNLKQWNEATKDTYESFKSLMELNQKMLEKGIAFQRELMEATVSGVNKQAEKAGKATDFQTLVEVQADVGRESAKQMVENTQKAYELLEETRNEFTAWMEEHMKQAINYTKVA